mmetsp:Transcript_25840/g.55263  ORF Transcript_25840/g.55263 Transcript_25840/m.55263 type:complete len:270 (+) Transcript_25840:2380-3189(+)
MGWRTSRFCRCIENMGKIQVPKEIVRIVPKNMVENINDKTFLNVPSQKVSLGGRFWACGDGGLPVRLVNEDGTEVPDDVDDTKHETTTGKHGEIRSIAISLDRTTCIICCVVEGTFNGVLGGVDLLTFLFGVGDCGIEKVEDLIGRVHLDVDNENHEDQHAEDDDGVYVTGQEGCLKSTRGSVQNNTPRNQEGCYTVIHSSQGFDGGGTTEQKHGSDNDVGEEAEKEEGQVGGFSPAGIDDFAYGVGGWSNLLEVDGEHSEQQDLDSGT